MNEFVQVEISLKVTMKAAVKYVQKITLFVL